ncbi:MAG: diaminopimelate decarboxylase [Thermoguttaceae bacterium]|nr:diaminopimelate decarboxylase [Thermoguttaceae bacterium]
MPVPVQMPPILREIAGVPIPEIVRQFGTPVFVYDEARILSQLHDLEAFDVVRYAQKACSNLAILQILHKAGAKVDAVSAMEIRRAIAAGFKPRPETEEEIPEIVYTADIFDREALDLCVEYGIHVNCGSIDMIHQLGKALNAREDTEYPIEITIRINPGFGHGHSQKTNTGGPLSKHGIWYQDIPTALAVAGKYGIAITGLHIHIGSGTDFEHLAQCCSKMKDFAMVVGSSVHTISTGGGLPTVYKEGDEYVDIQKYFELWDRTRCEIEQMNQSPVTLEIEPGRYLVAESGYLLAEVRAVKTQGGTDLFYLLDAGFNNLARPMLYGSYHPMSLCPMSGEPNEERPIVPAVVCGPLCESGDVFTQEEGGYVVTRPMPRAWTGDILVMGCAGAYGFVMGSNYNSKLYAPEVLIRDKQMICVRKRQTFEQLIENEILLDG